MGIPPLFDSRGVYEDYSLSATSDRSNFSIGQHSSPTTDTVYNRDAGLPSNRHVPPQLMLHDHIHELVSPGLATATLQNPQLAQNNGVTASPSHRHNASSASLGGMSPSEAAAQWPLDRVLIWLAKNGFSREWQETFKVLEIQGADFIELGHGSHGRGNLGKMHHLVYPQLAKECIKSGTARDQTHEREEGKRMRKLIRQIQDDSSNGDISATSNHRRRESQPFLPSASSEGGMENSPNLGWDSLAFTFSGSAENNTIAQQQGFRAASSLAQNSTTPGRSANGTPSVKSNLSDSTGFEHPAHVRSEFSRNALAHVDEFRKPSPAASSDNGLYPAPLAYRHEGSPRAESPPIPPGGLSSSGNFEHSRGNSADSSLATRPGSGTMPRFYESRKQTQDGLRPSTQDSLQSKDNSKSFLNIFKKKSKSSEGSHPSPEEPSLESPTSPASVRQNGLPFMKPGYNTSDMSLGDRPVSATLSDYERALSRKPAIRGKKYIMVTMDGWNYRLVDITESESAESMRQAICQSLGIVDWSSAQIFPTEPGQVDHDDPMNDTLLALSRRAKSDSVASLKFLVRGTRTHPGLLNSSLAGLGIPILVGEPKSDLLSSRQSTLRGQSPSNSESQGNTPALRDGEFARRDNENNQADLLVRQEIHERENEKKQAAYYQSKQSPSGTPKRNSYGEKGYVRGNVIDFDKPRHSPFEEKPLIPLRKPPSAPSESNTLSKVNSLSKKPSDWIRSCNQRQPEVSRPSQGNIIPEGNTFKRISDEMPALGYGLASAEANVFQPSSTSPPSSGKSATDSSTPQSRDTFDGIGKRLNGRTSESLFFFFF